MEAHGPDGPRGAVLPGALSPEDNGAGTASAVARRLGPSINKDKSQPDLMAQALMKSGSLKEILKTTKEGHNILHSHGMQLAQSLADVWDTDLSTEFKVELGLTDWQLHEMRHRCDRSSATSGVTAASF